ncbi:hypothetical protein GCM10023228_12000 [Brevibacillus fulvus]
MQRIFGIMTHRIKDVRKFLPYYRVARSEGFDDVVVFTPSNLNLNRKTVVGYRLKKSVWLKQTSKLPAICYDIGYYSSPASISKVRAIKQHPSVPFITYGLGNKWKIHQQLSRFPELNSCLIPTQVCDSPQALLDMALQHATIIIKPINGKEGKGILRLRRFADKFLLEQNDQPSVLLDETGLANLFAARFRTNRYLMQKWIDIRNKQGTVYDVRVLMQKNGAGSWTIAGMAAREGGAGRITSNLMDGGTPHPLAAYLFEQFRKKRAKKIIKRLTRLSPIVCSRLEESYQRRQAELGLDWAIDAQGHVWLIEVNIKPGKIPFRSVFPFETIEDGIRLPIQYARYVLEQELADSKVDLPAGKASS